MKSRDEELRLCRKTIARLTEENGLLRRSSESFGELAERLSNRLKLARQTGSGGGSKPGGANERE